MPENTPDNQPKKPQEPAKKPRTSQLMAVVTESAEKASKAVKAAVETPIYVPSTLQMLGLGGVITAAVMAIRGAMQEAPLPPLPPKPAILNKYNVETPKDLHPRFKDDIENGLFLKDCLGDKVSLEEIKNALQFTEAKGHLYKLAV